MLDNPHAEIQRLIIEAGHPCAGVKSAAGSRPLIVECKDGNTYRVHVSAEGKSRFDPAGIARELSKREPYRSRP
jgi:hypothetical protein